MRLKDKTAFITGGGSGIGRAVATRFAEEGATVIVTDIDTDAAAETVDQIEDAGNTAESHDLDVRNEEAFQAAIGATVETHGLDVVVNNAGVSHDRLHCEEISTEVRDRTIDVNIKGVWNGCHSAIPYLKQQQSGSIINTASIVGINARAQLSAYSLTKGAVVNLTQSLAAEVGPYGVRVNAVCPSTIITPLVRGSRSEEELEEHISRKIGEHALPRVGRPEDVANAMLYLASDEAAWVTGHSLFVDGGRSVL